MEIFGIGIQEIVFILIIALIVLGPKEMQKTGRTIGRWLNQLVRSDFWKIFQKTSAELRNLPRNLMREANLDDLQDVNADVNRKLQSVNEEVNQEVNEIRQTIDPRARPTTRNIPPAKKTDPSPRLPISAPDSNPPPSAPADTPAEPPAANPTADDDTKQND